ncbi:GGDEF domain-containing protein [Fusibacter bizertensis]
MDHKKTNILGICISLVVLIGFVVILSQSGGNSELKLADSPIYSLNDGWEISHMDSLHQNITLPFKEKLPAMEIIYAKRILPDVLPENTSLRLRASMQKISILIDEKLIYEGQLAPSEPIHFPEASVWVIVPLPNDSQGKPITVLIQSPIRAFSGIVNTIYYGESDALLYDTFNENKLSVIIAFILILVGIMSFIVSMFVRNLSDRRIFYLSLFATFVGIWLLSEAKVMQFFTGNRLIIGGISYMVISLIPVPLLLYLRDTTLQAYSKYFFIPIAIFISSFFINLGLQLFGICHYIQSISVTNTLMFLTMLLIIIVLFYEAIHRKNQAAKKFLLSLGIMAVVLTFELYDYFTENYYSISKYTRFGILIFFSLLVIDSFKYINIMITKQSETNLYEKLAYVDILTGANNRTAFERDIHNTVRESFDIPIRLILFDIDNLKLINDNYGHKVGDLAIMSTYECIQSTFNSCYRIGGDEFASLLQNCSDIELNEKIVDLRKMMMNKSKYLPYNYELSVGDAIFNPTIDDFDKCFEIADQKLYIDKKNKPVLHV